MPRDPQSIQREIEHARDALASTFDQLAERTSPKTLAEKAKLAVIEKAKTPAGMAVIGVAAGLTTFLVVRRIRRR